MENNLYYKTREDKPRWVVQNFNKLFKVKSVLDIGCDKKQLKNFLPFDVTRYIGIDISNEADIKIDLESAQPLPLEDKEFELVVALDVLEHLENIHQIFDEACRISSKYILISLPNNLQAAIKGYVFKRYNKDPQYQFQYGKYAKFYGLPFERPVDRHRWFFNSEEAEDFLRYRANKHGFKIADIQYEIDFQSPLKRLIKKIATGFSRRRMLNFYSGTIFFVLERQ